MTNITGASKSDTLPGSALGDTLNSVEAKCLALGNRGHRWLSGRGHLIAIGLLSLAISACGGGGGGGGGGTSTGPVSDGTDGGSTGTTKVLDCERDDYPCSFADVDLTVIERSLVLSDEVANSLEQGMDIEQVGADLAANSEVVDVTVDGPVLAFRLAGGRPMIVDVTGDQEFLPNAVDAKAPDTREFSERVLGVSGAADQAGAAQKRSTIRSAVTPSAITGDSAQRSALVLSPFRYEANFGNSGELVANALNGVRGYTGNVTYLATTDEFDPQVTVDALTQLHQYDVIHIDTHGGTLCKKKEIAEPTTLAKDKDKKKCEDGVTDFLVQRFHGTAADLQSITHPGVVHYRGRLHQSIAVTADFFRHYYPDGLTDRLFMLGSCNTYRTDMADAIAGSRGIYVSWDGYTEYSLVRNTSLALLDSLGLGLTVGEAFARLPNFSPENPAAQGSVLRHTGRRQGGDLRIRDLITVRDSVSGNLVTDTSGIAVRGVPGDGQNDNLDLEFTVDGISPEQLANFHLNLVIEGEVIGHLNLEESGVQAGDFSYVVSTAVPLPFDVENGQILDMDFWIPLPDLGEDHYIAAPKVNEQDTPEVGSGWALSSQATQSRNDDLTIKTATVEFEIEPGDDPEGRFRYFRVTTGSVRIQRDYTDALGCRFNIDHTISIPAAAENNYLRFDVGDRDAVLEGFGSVAAETIQVTNSCGEQANVSVGGVYFVAEDIPVSGEFLSGGYNDGAARPTVIEWTLSKNF